VKRNSAPSLGTAFPQIAPPWRLDDPLRNGEADACSLEVFRTMKAAEYVEERDRRINPAAKSELFTGAPQFRA